VIPGRIATDVAVAESFGQITLAEKLYKACRARTSYSTAMTPLDARGKAVLSAIIAAAVCYLCVAGTMVSHVMWYLHSPLCRLIICFSLTWCF
jgi:hypothetical protein